MRSMLGMCVSRLTTASAPSNARRRDASSNTSASTARAPRLSSSSRPRAERVTPVTRWPAASNSRTARRPMTPVDPVITKSFMPTPRTNSLDPDRWGRQRLARAERGGHNARLARVAKAEHAPGSELFDVTLPEGFDPGEQRPALEAAAEQAGWTIERDGAVIVVRD